MIHDLVLLQAARVGMLSQLGELEVQIAVLQGKDDAKLALRHSPAPKKNNMSAEARERISAAQRKRWALAKKADGPQAVKATHAVAKKRGGKRQMSAEGRERIAKATRERWAAFREAKAAKAAGKPVVKGTRGRPRKSKVETSTTALIAGATA